MPYTLAGTALVYLLARNVSKALSVLMVDFSCALKLAIEGQLAAVICIEDPLREEYGLPHLPWLIMFPL